MNTGITFRHFLLGTSLMLLSHQAYAVMSIRPQPMDTHQHNRNAGKVFILNGAENSQVYLMTPQLDSREIIPSDNRISFKPTGQDNYHALVAQRQYIDGHGKSVHEAVVRYVYMNGKPTGRSPAELTAAKKNRLEIVPDPLPREHWHYKAGDRATFSVRFDDELLPDLEVSLATSHGSVIKSRTSRTGKVTFILPDDFPETRPGRQNNPAAELLLHTSWLDDGKQYASWLSADYQVDPSHWQNSNLGVMIASGGFVIGAFITGLGFRNKSKPRNKN